MYGRYRREEEWHAEGEPTEISVTQPLPDTLLEQAEMTQRLRRAAVTAFPPDLVDLLFSVLDGETAAELRFAIRLAL